MSSFSFAIHKLQSAVSLVKARYRFCVFGNTLSPNADTAGESVFYSIRLFRSMMMFLKCVICSLVKPDTSKVCTSLSPSR